MSSVQDHTPVVKELSERRQPDTQTSPSEPLQTAQPPVPPQARDPSDLPRVVTSEAPREYSPPRFSQLLDTLPEGSDPHPPKRGISTGTNSVTLVNYPGIIGNPPNNDAGLQHPSVIQERSQPQPTPVSDRRPVMYDPIRGDPVVHTQLSDDGDHGRGSSVRRVSVPRPRPVFSPTQDGNVNGGGNGSRVGGLRTGSGGEPYSNPPGPQDPVSLALCDKIAGSETLTFVF